METVRFRIQRKKAFAGCALTYRLYINGDFVGALKNDSPDSYFYRSAVSNGNAMIKNCLKNGAYEEFHKCMVHDLIDNILTEG